MRPAHERFEDFPSLAPKQESWNPRVFLTNLPLVLIESLGHRSQDG